MKSNYFFKTITLAVIFAGFLYPWGDDGHKLIAEKGLESVPADMQQFQPWFQLIVAKSVDPDYRKADDKEEGPKHYIDLDFYNEILSGSTIINRGKLEEKYSASTVKKMGLLPFALLDTYTNLVKAYKAHDKEKAVLYMADMAHYVGDGHQPMHTITNYDGQLTNQKGLHARYEIHMIEKHFDEVKKAITPGNPSAISNIKEFVNNMIFDTHTSFPILMYADSVAYFGAEKNYNDKYYNTLWLFTKKLTVERIAHAAETLAAIYISAWKEAGMPGILEFK